MLTLTELNLNLNSHTYTQTQWDSGLREFLIFFMQCILESKKHLLFVYEIFNDEMKNSLNTSVSNSLHFSASLLSVLMVIYIPDCASVSDI